MVNLFSQPLYLNGLGFQIYLTSYPTPIPPFTQTSNDTPPPTPRSRAVSPSKMELSNRRFITNRERTPKINQQEGGTRRRRGPCKDDQGWSWCQGHAHQHTLTHTNAPTELLANRPPPRTGAHLMPVFSKLTFPSDSHNLHYRPAVEPSTERGGATSISPGR